MSQWNKSTIHASTDTSVTNGCVYRVGKINWTRTQWQSNHAAFGGKHKDLVLVKIGFQTLHELRRISNIALPVNDAIQPINIGYFVVIFVRPVCCYSPLGSLMHFTGANLNFEGLATRPNDSRVQTLIQVEFRHCDVVLEPPHNGFPSPVNTAQGCVAIFHRINDDTNGDDVENLVKLFSFLDHLFVDAPQVLATTSDI